MRPDVRVHDGTAPLVAAAADLVLESARDAVRERGRFVWGLAGGSTPRALYEALAAPPYADAMPWGATHIFWGDERWVPADDAESNRRMAREALLDAASPASVVPIRAEGLTPAESAASAEEGLRRVFGGEPPRPDLLLLGIGSDGHTASLFPGTDGTAGATVVETSEGAGAPVAPVVETSEGAGAPVAPVVETSVGAGAPEEAERLFAARWIPQLGAWRVTATFRLIGAARRVVFLAQGREKADAVGKALRPIPGEEPVPAALAAPEGGAAIWLLDREAAGEAGETGAPAAGGRARAGVQ